MSFAELPVHQLQALYGGLVLQCTVGLLHADLGVFLRHTTTKL